jgi:hypothetical protein
MDALVLEHEGLLPFFFTLQASNVQLPQAQLPPAAAPNARDCTPTRRSINPQMLPGTPQTAPAAASLSRTGQSLPNTHYNGGHCALSAFAVNVS